MTTVRLSEDIAVDIGPNKEIWGIEVLSASKHLGLAQKGRKPKVDLENLEVDDRTRAGRYRPQEPGMTSSVRQRRRLRCRQRT